MSVEYFAGYWYRSEHDIFLRLNFEILNKDNPSNAQKIIAMYLDY